MLLVTNILRCACSWLALSRQRKFLASQVLWPQQKAILRMRILLHHLPLSLAGVGGHANGVIHKPVGRARLSTSGTRADLQGLLRLKVDEEPVVVLESG